MGGKRMKKDYTIGLDIGTNSVGYTVITDDYKLIAKKMKVFGNTDKKTIKKNFWGVRLFDSGETAQETRMKRTSRRRTSRRKNRLCYIQELFKPEIDKFDSNFFYRLNESFLTEEDAKFDKHPIFGTLEEEVSFHQKFPTIYHLRKYLADTDEQADLRFVYLAIAHIVKYRGNFLIEGELNTENHSVKELSKNFIQIYNQALNNLEDFQEVDKSVDFSNELVAQLSKTERMENVLKLFPNEKGTGTLAQFIRLIVGNQANFKKVFQLEEDHKIQFSEDDYEENLENLLAIIGDEYSDVFVIAQKLYQAVLLAGILTVGEEKTKARLSAAMIKRYEDHAEDLKALKLFVREKMPDRYKEVFNDVDKDGYAGYIDGKTKEEQFYKYLKNLLSNVDGSEYFLQKIDQENFLRKQRTYDNGVIPHQIHAEELNAIIRRQEKYYPFLKENHKKIEQIFKVRIPYYVGPLAKNKEQSRFSWNIRNTDDAVRPWNLDEVINKDASAIAFIERMTIKDIYLGENVLPRHSLMYEKFTIFNELTKVTYSDDRGVYQKFSASEKKDIFNKLFKQDRKITRKKLENYLVNELAITSPTVKGIEEQFNANFGTYLDLKKFDELAPYLDNEEFQDVLEEIVKILTVFEDRMMIQNQLAQLPLELSPKTIKSLSRKKYTGWGRLSAKLIDGIKDKQTGKTILDFLIEDETDSILINRNFMQLINDDNLTYKKIIEDNQPFQEKMSVEDIVMNLSGSPAIKKGILQSLKIVDELVKIMGYNPKNIVVEMARENQTTGRGKLNSKPRLKGIENGLKAFSDSALKENPTDNRQLQNDRLYLYYLQNGKDMYTGKALDIDHLSDYDVDHIIPQSFITDNSIDNRVLTTSKANRGKLDNVPSEEVVSKMENFWRKLLKEKLISERKFANLTKRKLTDNDKAGFISRQLVETRQITKNVANILDSRFNTDSSNREVQVITLKSSLVSEFRKTFHLFKVREINDLHHAHDAYLNAVVAISLLKVYPQLKPEFVYGEYGKNSIHEKNKATVKKQIYSNIMRFFSKEEVMCNEDGEILWNKKQAIAQITKTLGKHQVNVVKKVEVQKGGFYDQNILKKGKYKKIYDIKRNLSGEKYGGYVKPTNSLSIILKEKKKKKILGITILDKQKYDENPKQFLDEKGFKNAELISKLRKYTLYETKDGTMRMVSSEKEALKANQLILSNELTTMVYHIKEYKNKESSISKAFIESNLDLLKKLSTELIEFAVKYIKKPLVIEEIKQMVDHCSDKNNLELAESLFNMLFFIHAGSSTEFVFMGKKISRDRLRYQSISDVFNAEIIHQSVTGLYETRISLAED